MAPAGSLVRISITGSRAPEFTPSRSMTAPRPRRRSAIHRPGTTRARDRRAGCPGQPASHRRRRRMASAPSATDTATRVALGIHREPPRPPGPARPPRARAARRRHCACRRRAPEAPRAANTMRAPVRRPSDAGVVAEPGVASTRRLAGGGGQQQDARRARHRHRGHPLRRPETACSPCLRRGGRAALRRCAGRTRRTRAAAFAAFREDHQPAVRGQVGDQREVQPGQVALPVRTREKSLQLEPHGAAVQDGAAVAGHVVQHQPAGRAHDFADGAGQRHRVQGRVEAPAGAGEPDLASIGRPGETFHGGPAVGQHARAPRRARSRPPTRGRLRTRDGRTAPRAARPVRCADG